MKGNPCKGIRKFTLTDRDVYIPDKDYLAVYECAAPEIQVAMEISYLCAREGDVLDLRIADVRHEGIFIEQNKTGKKQIKQWSPRLQAAVGLAIEKLSGRSAAGFLIPGPSGGTMNKKTFNTGGTRQRKLLL